MKISVGNYDVMESGVVIALKNQPVVFELNDRTNTLVARFLFEDTGLSGEPDVSFNFCGVDRLDIVFQNFINVLGAGPVDALELGEINGRKLYLACRIYSINDNRDKIVYYTWYLGEYVSGEDPDRQGKPFRRRTHEKPLIVCRTEESECLKGYTD